MTLLAFDVDGSAVVIMEEQCTCPRCGHAALIMRNAGGHTLCSSCSWEEQHSRDLDAMEAQDACGVGQEPPPSYPLPVCKRCGSDMEVYDWDDEQGRVQQCLRCPGPCVAEAAP